MENCMEAKALKPSLRRELAMKSTQQVFFEDYWGLNGTNGVSISDDFSVDYFLDFSHEEVEEELYINEQEEEEKDFLSVFSQDDNTSNSSTFSSESLLASELSVPVDEEKELEWVSHFVDDSQQEFSLLYPKIEIYAKNRAEPEPKPVLARGLCFHLPVPAKARSKRPRTTIGRVWSLGSPSLSETSSSSSSSSSTGLSSTSCLSVQSMGLSDTCSEPPSKKLKKKPAVQTGELLGQSPFQRRCSHCLVQKTPQWRTGPLGAKTLCNACGVRYKSGRLFPEYRPACSPTFSGDIHSNSHRKVLEIRKNKDTVGPEFELTQMVQNFEGYRLRMD